MLFRSMSAAKSDFSFLVNERLHVVEEVIEDLNDFVKEGGHEMVDEFRTISMFAIVFDSIVCNNID